MFSASVPTPGSRPSTTDSKVRTTYIGDEKLRPKSAGATYDPTDVIIERLGTANKGSSEWKAPTPRVVTPTLEYENAVSEMHPHVPTPEPTCYDDLDGRCYIEHCCYVRINNIESNTNHHQIFHDVWLETFGQILLTYSAQ